ncbi:MAG: lysozyme, partial [Caulobacterales bacterium]|nr:lysozyme [Caulobacterales bacterium]
VNREQAEELLRWDIGPIEDFIRQHSLTPLNQNQFDAIVSFVFNIGLEDFKTSDVLKHLNRGEPVAAAIAMAAWRNANLNGQNIVVDALVRRRALEASMFLDTQGPRPAAPTPVIKPLLDYRASLLAPKADLIKEISFEKENGAAIIKEEIPQIDLGITEEEKNEILNEALVENSEITDNENLVPFPNMDKVAIENNIEVSTKPEMKIANANEASIELPANDLQKPNQNSALRETVASLSSEKKKLKLEPLTVFVIVAGFIAFIAGLYEAIGQNIFANGLYQLGQNQSHVFVALTLVIGLIASILGIISLLNAEKE